MVCFLLGGQELAAPIRAVKETIGIRPLTRVFLVPPFVAGLMNLRGEVVAVLDLGQLLGFGAHTVDTDRRRHPEAAIVILRPSEALGTRAQGRAAAGLLVERLIGVRDVPAELVQPTPATLHPETALYLRGVATMGDPPRPLLLIDPEKVLAAEQLRPFRRDRPANATSS
jgi:purine-binding chemotaxis protein CheW